MQRRAATVSVAIFLLLAVGSYSLIGAAQQPDVSLENPEYSLSENQTETIGETTYNFSEIEAESAAAVWTNESARQTATLEQDQNVTYEGGNYTVAIPNESDPTEFELREIQTIDRPTVEQNGTTYVIVEEDGDQVLVERDEYLPDQTVYRFQEGDQFDYQNNSTTVDSVESSSVTLAWTAPAERSLEFAEGENTTIGETNYLAHFVEEDGEPVLQLTTNYDDYHSDRSAQSTFNERMNGLWGVTILSSIAAALLAMVAFLPSRY
jgi:hypothetical protein